MSADVTFNFAGKAALITGGTSGIGWATARAFARAGAKVAVCGLAPPDPPQFEDQLRQDGAPDALFVPLDVRSAPDVERAVAAVADRFGGFQIAVNNAGIEGRFGPLETLEPEDFDQLVSVNLRGVWCGMKYEILHMARQGGVGRGGVIVNTASTAGLKSIRNVSVYSATKHAIIGLTKGAALEQAANGIRVNAVAPGPVSTGLLSRMVAGHVALDDIARSVPLGRISSPDEIADAILWLASDAAAYVTGETVVIDGGLTQG
jgi:NAD(P)-dependent dehydrogenase (short-subunit alcohol dehydrogenase family)